MPTSSTETSFSCRLLSWWQTHGRHDLPWQIERTPYRVWVAEVMLQQTQVAAVTGYFERFMQTFPTLEDLARARLDDVLALWSGLGYYARARNLHATAAICMETHGGRLPEEPEQLEALPGIGRSTAHAIVAQAFDRRAPILDGNVKRLLARHAGISGWPGKSAVQRRLWQESERCTPATRAADFTQAIMDLGAAVCRPRKPDCRNCPVRHDCVAFRDGRVDELPGRRPAKDRPRRQATFLIFENKAGRIWLERRPPAGIWGGLWCLPSTDDPAAHGNAADAERLEPVVHHFTHFILEMHLLRLPARNTTPIKDGSRGRWVIPREALRIGLPRPVRAVIEKLAGENS